MNSRNLSTRSVLLGWGIVLLTGCVTTGMDDLEQYLTEVKNRKAPPIDPLPEIKQVETFLYVAGDRRNPFEPEKREEAPSEEAAGEGGIAPDPFRVKEELEAFSLDTIRMVGILKQQDTMWGLVQTKDGIIHRVKVGNYLGENHGQIMRISEERIDLTEIVPDTKGGFRERRASLAVGEKK